jgi:hypothetical protein
MQGTLCQLVLIHAGFLGMIVGQDRPKRFSFTFCGLSAFRRLDGLYCDLFLPLQSAEFRQTRPDRSIRPVGSECWKPSLVLDVNWCERVRPPSGNLLAQEAAKDRDVEAARSSLARVRRDTPKKENYPTDGQDC